MAALHSKDDRCEALPADRLLLLLLLLCCWCVQVCVVLRCGWRVTFMATTKQR
jgi:hypothetical protein